MNKYPKCDKCPLCDRQVLITEQNSLEKHQKNKNKCKEIILKCMVCKKPIIPYIHSFYHPKCVNVEYIIFEN